METEIETSMECSQKLRPKSTNLASPATKEPNSRDPLEKRRIGKTRIEYPNRFSILNLRVLSQVDFADEEGY